MLIPQTLQAPTRCQHDQFVLNRLLERPWADAVASLSDVSGHAGVIECMTGPHTNEALALHFRIEHRPGNLHRGRYHYRQLMWVGRREWVSDNVDPTNFDREVGRRARYSQAMSTSSTAGAELFLDPGQGCSLDLERPTSELPLVQSDKPIAALQFAQTDDGVSAGELLSETTRAL